MREHSRAAQRRNQDTPVIAPDKQLCIAIYQAANRTSRLYRSLLADHGLTFPQYQAMLALWHQGPMTVGTLCSALDLETSTLTPVLKRLQMLGYVMRFRDLADERRVHVALTDKGQALKQHAFDIRRLLIDTVGMPISEIENLRRTLHAVSASIDRALSRRSTG